MFGLVDRALASSSSWGMDATRVASGLSSWDTTGTDGSLEKCGIVSCGYDWDAGGSGSAAVRNWPGEAKGEEKGDSRRPVPSASGIGGDWYCANGSSGGAISYDA